MDDNLLFTGTLCMTAKTAIATQYNVHSLYGYSETVSTMKSDQQGCGGRINLFYVNIFRALKTIVGKRSIVISRSTYPNSGQHGGHWLGDNKSAWSDLYLSIPGIKFTVRKRLILLLIWKVRYRNTQFQLVWNSVCMVVAELAWSVLIVVMNLCSRLVLIYVDSNWLPLLNFVLAGCSLGPSIHFHEITIQETQCR